MRSRHKVLITLATLMLAGATAAVAGILTAGNGIYTIYVADQAEYNCGAWTATTGPSHPAGSGHNVLYGDGYPSTSYTTLRSYTTGLDFQTGSGSYCLEICDQSRDTSLTTLMNGAVPVGFRFTWTLPVSTSSDIILVQEVVVEGPVDGTETVDNTIIRETHTVRNETGGLLHFGLRKMWDWEIGYDDGPWLGDCRSPDAACDRSMNLTDDESEDGPYPDAYTINEDPAESACPGSIVPNNPFGCGGNPLYLVAGTIAGPESLDPPPDPPELFQFNEWGSQYYDCWLPGRHDSATCGGGDTAAAYFYGLTDTTALELDDGEERSFTQYVVAGQDACPDIISEPSEGTVFSTPSIEFVSYPEPILELYPENAYEVTYGVPSIGQFGPTFLPQSLNLDALDVVSSSMMLFSVNPGGVVSHPGGVTQLHGGDVYRVDLASGIITPDPDWAGFGLHLPTLNAIDKLGDGSYAFSTAGITYRIHQNALLVLRPWNVYRIATDGTVSLLMDGAALGLSNVDAVDVLSDGRIAFSSASTAFMFPGGNAIQVYDRDVYIFDPGDGTVVKHSELDAVDLDGLDAVTVEVAE